MNGVELRVNVAAAAGLTQDQAAAAIEGFKNAVSLALVAGDQVAIDDFGRFFITRLKDRAGTNPRTHMPIFIQGRADVNFAPGAALVDALN